MSPFSSHQKFRLPAFLAIAVLTTLHLAPFPGIAQAEEAATKGNYVTRIIGSQPVRLVLPENTCAMDPNNPSDKRVIDGTKISIRGSNELLLQFADCQELKDWRSGKQKYLNNFGNYQTSLKLKNTSLKGKEGPTTKAICNVFKKQGAELMDALKPEARKRVAEGFKNVRLNEVKMIAVLHDTADLCAASTYQRLKTDDDSMKEQLGVYSVTFLKGRILFSYLFAPNSDKNLADLSSKISKLNDKNQSQNK